MYNDETDIYQNYNADRYIHYRNIPTGEYEIVKQKRNGKEVHVRMPILEKKKVSFEEIKKINLDNYGLDVRTNGEDFTLVHNYFLDFWGTIMGIGPSHTYIHLKRFAYGSKDFCFPNIPVLMKKMGISRPTLLKYLDILEKYGFVAKILRADTEKDNISASPFFKIRRYIPLLTKDLVEQLPEDIREEHDKFLAKTQGIELDETVDTSKLFDDLMKTSEIMKSKAQEMKENELKRRGQFKEYLVTQLTDQQQENWYMILTKIKDKVSKPSFDTWFANTLILVNETSHKVTVITPNSFCSDWIASRQKDMLIETVKEVFSIRVETFEIYTYEQYIDAMN